MLYWPCFLLMKFLDLIFFNTKFIGVDNIPKDTSFIFASNHISNLDPFIIGISRWRRYSYMAKDSLFKKKLVGWFFHNVGAFPIKRDKSDLRALREALKRLKAGCPLILFPEGTRGAGNREKKPQAGIGFLANKSNKPVLPVYIVGSDKALPNGAKWLRRHRITVTIGKPIHLSDKQTYPEISSFILKNIYALSPKL